MLPHDLLHHYCDLNEIPYHISRDTVIDYIVQYPTHAIAYETPYGRVFDTIHQFVKGEIDLEMVMIRGDMNHTYHIMKILPSHANCFVYDSLMTEQIGEKYHTMIKIL